MTSDAVTVVRGAVDAVNDRSLGDRAAELLDPSFIRHDLAQVLSDSHGPGSASDFVSMIIAAMPDFHLGIEDIVGTGDRKEVRPHARPPIESGHRAGEGLPSFRRHYLNVPCPHTPGGP